VASDLAAYDLQTWATTMLQLVPSYQARSDCGTDETRSFTCILTITWVERYGRNAQTAPIDSLATSGTQSFTLYIQP
jgi:type IV pilus assembly protein PilV